MPLHENDIVKSPHLLIPVGSHFFTPDALQSAVKAATDAENNGHTNALAGTVDSSGTKVALILGSKDGNWKLQTAFAHDWDGANSFGAKGSYSW